MQKTKELIVDDSVERDELSNYFSVVTLSPKRDADNAIIKKLQMIQMKERSQWKGIVVDSVGQPGKGILLKGAYEGYANMQLDYEDRATMLIEFINKVKQGNLSAIAHNQRKREAIIFRSIQKGEMKRDHAPSNCYAKGHSSEGDELLYKLLKSDARLVRSVLEVNGFKHTDGHDWNIFWANGHTKTYLFEGLNQYQKINHFPGSLEITRKDRLCENVVRFQNKFGKSAFYIIPDTYILPDEFQEFYSHFHELKQNIPYALWILKPNQLSRGRGIYLIDDIREVPLDEGCVISRYVGNPLLINGLKFDLRIYALMTSIEPLRIYVFNEGLTRFASERYLVSHNSKSNRYAHLTNYSVNKKNAKFVSNKSAGEDDKGNKWSISALCKHLESIGVDTNLLWSRIYDIIIKTILSSENVINTQFKKLVTHRKNCFELFGFDVLIDSDLRPWLMEVNLSPSLAADSPLDMQIKSALVSDMFTLLGVQAFDRKKEGLFKSKVGNNTFYNMRNTSYNNNKSIGKLFSQDPCLGLPDDPDPLALQMFKKITGLPPKLLEILTETLEEYERRRNFVRIYPAKGSEVYDKYFEQVRPLNKFLYKYLYGSESEKMKYYMEHSTWPRPEQVVGEGEKEEEVNVSTKQGEGKEESNSCISQASTATTTASLPQSDTVNIQKTSHLGGKNPSLCKPKEEIKEKNPRNNPKEIKKEESREYDLLITGDDILIEYAGRLIYHLRNIKEYQMNASWRNSIESFCQHTIWFTSIPPTQQGLAKKLQLRLEEMKGRRKKLMKKMSEKGTGDFEEEYRKTENQKKVFLKEYSTEQMEDMLKLSAKSNAFEVVGFLIQQNGKGLVGRMEEWLSRNPQGNIRLPSEAARTQTAWTTKSTTGTAKVSRKSADGGSRAGKSSMESFQNAYGGLLPIERPKYGQLSDSKPRIMTANSSSIPYHRLPGGTVVVTNKSKYNPSKKAMNSHLKGINPQFNINENSTTYPIRDAVEAIRRNSIGEN